MADNKTEESFWTKFWEKINLPVTVDYSFKNDCVIAESFKKYIPKAIAGQKALEIGCAPGKWMGLFNRELGYNVSGIEYLEVVAKKTIENFKVLQITEMEYEVQATDLFNVIPSNNFDVVFSLGFIEHFDDWENVIDKYIAFCKSSSYLVLGLPSFRGIGIVFRKSLESTLTKLLHYQFKI